MGTRTFNELDKISSLKVYAKTAARALYFFHHSRSAQEDLFGLKREIQLVHASQTSVDSMDLNHPLMRALIDTFKSGFFVLQQAPELEMLLVSLAIRPDGATMLPEHLRPLLAHLIYTMRLVATVLLQDEKLARQTRAALPPAEQLG
jgi:hypothetical protein